jgi:hypothetical protein
MKVYRRLPIIDDLSTTAASGRRRKWQFTASTDFKPSNGESDPDDEEWRPAAHRVGRRGFLSLDWDHMYSN